MNCAIDTNVLVRFLVQEAAAPEQTAAARQLVDDVRAGGTSVHIGLGVLLETGRAFDAAAAKLPGGQLLVAGPVH